MVPPFVVVCAFGQGRVASGGSPALRRPRRADRAAGQGVAEVAQRRGEEARHRAQRRRRCPRPAGPAAPPASAAWPAGSPRRRRWYAPTTPPRTTTPRNGRSASSRPRASAASSEAPSGHGARAAQQRRQLGAAGLFGGDARKPVLDDPVADALLAQLAPDAAQIRDRQAAVVRRRWPPCAARERPRPAPRPWPLGLGWHVASFPCRAPACRRPPLRRPAQGPAGAASQPDPGGGPVSSPASACPSASPALADRSCVDDFGPVRRASPLARGAVPSGAPRTQRCLWRNGISLCGGSCDLPALRPPPVTGAPGPPRGCRGPWSRRPSGS